MPRLGTVELPTSLPQLEGVDGMAMQDYTKVQELQQAEGRHAA